MKCSQELVLTSGETGLSGLGSIHCSDGVLHMPSCLVIARELTSRDNTTVSKQ